MSRSLKWAACMSSCAAVASACTADVHVTLLDRSGPDGSLVVDSFAPDGSYSPLSDERLEDLRNRACTGWSLARQADPATIMLVVDVSGSMNRPDPSAGSPVSKWQVVRPALLDAAVTLPASLGAGVLYYPNMPTWTNSYPIDPSACVNVGAVIPVERLGGVDSAQRRRIQASLHGTEPLEAGGTPTHDAYVVALDELRQTDLEGDRFMLLMTDGQPTLSRGCVGTGMTGAPVDVTPIIEEIQRARETGIGTFVIGSPGSELTPTVGEDARPWLSFAAEAGGTARPGCSHDGPEYCHFDMVSEPDFGAGLRAALGEIAGRIVDCDFELPSPPPGEELVLDQVNVVYTSHNGDSFLVLQDGGLPCSEGWRYSADGRRIELCERTCELVQNELGARLELLFGCDTIAVIR